MRELVFALEYEPGCNRVADALADHPDSRVRSLSLHVTAERLWRVDHATGTPAALEAVECAFLDGDYYADCLAADDCEATQTTRVLDRTDDVLVLYTDWKRTARCASVPHIARDRLGDGVLFETRHERRHYTWRLIHSGDGDVGAFFDDVRAAVDDCARLELLKSGTADQDYGSAEYDLADAGLPAEQAAALSAAVDHGYYESPREIDAGELADHLGIPRSTLTYRLRRAEAQLAERHVADSGPDRPTTSL